MKKLTKTIIAGILCAVIAITSVVTTNTGTAYAAGKTPLKVTFKGKTVTLTKDINKEQRRPKVKTLKSKWGKPSEAEDCYDEYTDKTLKTGEYYKWLKGKTYIFYSIQLRKLTLGGSARNHIQISSEDKNLKVNGIKVGMKKKNVEKILKNLGIGDDGWTKSRCVAISCNYKNGKVSAIHVEVEYLEDYE